MLQFAVKGGTKLLLVAKDADEALGGFFKDIFGGGAEGIFLQQKAVDMAYWAVLVRTKGFFEADPCAPPARIALRQGKPFLEILASVVDRPCRRVVILHEGLDSLKNVFLWVE
jgi:hypothetical protein